MESPEPASRPSDSPDIRFGLGESWIAEVFDKCPLGIVQTDHDGKLLYLSNTGISISGIVDWESKSLRDIFADEETFTFVQKQIQTRPRGMSEEYEGEITRQSDGKKIPIRISAMPVTSPEGKVAGGLSIFRSLELEKAVKQLDDLNDQARSSSELLTQVARFAAGVIPNDLFLAVAYSREFTHARVLLENPPGLRSGQRWYPVHNQIREFVAQENPTLRSLHEVY
jgi:PAS domain S-box-containing protein